MTWSEFVRKLSEKANEVGEGYAVIEPFTSEVIGQVGAGITNSLAALNHKTSRVLCSTLPELPSPLTPMYSVEDRIRKGVQTRQAPR